MAAISVPSEQAAKLLQKLSLDSLDKPLQDPEPTKKCTPADMVTQTNAFNKPFERTASPHPDFMDPSMFYNPGGYPLSTYYYGGFNGSSVKDWDWYGSSNGVDMPPAVSGDYRNSYGYAPYGTYSASGSTMGQDNPLYGPQNFQYPTYFPPVTSNSRVLFLPERREISEGEILPPPMHSRAPPRL